MKKIISLLVILVICCALVITLVACGEDNAENNTPHTCVDKNNDHLCDRCYAILSICEDDDNFYCDICERSMRGISIRFYVPRYVSRVRSVFYKYIDEFNRLYPELAVGVSLVEVEGGAGNVLSQIRTDMQSGTKPNVVYCTTDQIAKYILEDTVVSLDSLINSNLEIKRTSGMTEVVGLTDIQKDDFIPGFYAEGAQYGDGKMYSLPFLKQPEILYYNKTFFDKYGLTPPTTWDEMEEVCRRIKEIDRDCIPLSYDSASNWFITMCEQLRSGYISAEKGNHFLFDNQTNRDFVKRFRTWYEKGYLTTQALYGPYTSGLFTTVGESTADKKVVKSYMCIASPAAATYYLPFKQNGMYPFEVGITSVPQIDPANPSVISQGDSFCIFKNDNPMEVIASWLLVKFLTTNAEFQAELSIASSPTSGWIPVLQSAADSPVYRDYLDSAYLCEMVQDNKGNLVIARNPDGTAKFILDENGNKQYLGNDYIEILSKEICIAQANAYFTPPAFYGSSTARKEVGRLLEECLSTPGDADAVIDKAFKDALKECKYQISNVK